MSEAYAKYNISQRRGLYVLADAVHFEQIKKLLSTHYFVNPQPFHALKAEPEESYFAVAVCDFKKPASAARVARAMARLKSAHVRKILYSADNRDVETTWLLFGQEIGASFIAYGPRKNQEFRDYIKRVCVDDHYIGSVDGLSEELSAAYRENNEKGMKSVIRRLKELPRGEDVHRLLVEAYRYTAQYAKVERHLKEVLKLNTQNLWAANELGRLYLRSGRVGAGVELLQRMSRFHNFNSERLNLLGQVCLRSGMLEDAEDAFQKGLDLTDGEDERFRDGLVEVKLAEKDFEGAREIAGGDGFSEDVLVYLNMKAVMLVRSGMYEEGMLCYQTAIEGATKSKVTLAKLYFNQGLAYARHQNFHDAERVFKLSLELGGSSFQRARGPLEIVKRIKASARPSDRQLSEDENEEPVITEFDFEAI